MSNKECTFYFKNLLPKINTHLYVTKMKHVNTKTRYYIFRCCSKHSENLTIFQLLILTSYKSRIYTNINEYE